MPKRKNNRKGKKSPMSPPPLESSRTSVANSETTSVVSDMSEWPYEDNTSTEDILKDLFDGMAEKRSSARTASLKKLVKLLRAKVLPEDIAATLETFTYSINNCIRGRDSKETVMACHALGLAAWNMGVEEDTSVLYDTFEKTLSVYANDHTKNGAVRRAAIRTLAVLCFIAIDDVETTLSLISIARSMFKSKDPAVLEGASSALSLLCSTLGTNQLATKLFPKLGPPLLKLLDSKCVEVKENAGHTMGLLCESANLESDSDNLDEKQDRDVEVQMDRLAEKLGELQSVSSKSQHRKDKARIRAGFREILRTAEDGSVPQEKVTVKSTTVHINGWAKTIQYGEARRWLGIGIQQHLKMNPLLSAIFNYELKDLSRDEERATREDKIYQSKVSRGLSCVIAPFIYTCVAADARF
uniref:Interferon-related developmental regulator N-terminal domain-containing protein n=1 Tax=Lotharella oceanica TaxID=641309 RepID=A0A7S2TJ40_9EUKA|mmetsp:Transcript_1660/g.3121  ORF Transcript_1660/g.3121 Transcript_1660/m.3121 type:complete len:413 (+) Transcript_1660:66-1304(+)